MNSARRHIHLGTRLEFAERVRRGTVSTQDAARELGVGEADVRRWVESGERPVSLDELVASPQALRLTRRAQRLVALIADCDRTIRALSRRLAAGKGAAAQGAD